MHKALSLISKALFPSNLKKLLDHFVRILLLARWAENLLATSAVSTATGVERLLVVFAVIIVVVIVLRCRRVGGKVMNSTDLT